eukprot:NODE_1862_length_711_cov_137.988014_g1812_i0.p1 GENE.NODE_1862_length_711_cov_137.988014_g1812_i0~~NODE_1862_length_711_cov_137.988014_g1812_i0.p1  ORF type:complete len:230 (-),score=48.43 NODE_1862_length_711_cov_137.988014_g1812_i0:21-680(-)
MTTAHRPTWTPAMGKGNSSKTVSYSSRDGSLIPLKFRQSKEEKDKEDLKRALYEKEKEAALKTGRKLPDEPGQETLALELEPPTKRPRLEPNKLDADDTESEESGSDSDSDSDEDDDDDTAELLKELQQIKKEREEEEARLAQEKQEEEERIRTEQVLHGNPLMSGSQASSGDYSLKKKWYDDVVFKNCAKNEPKPEKRFINDTIRSDFHRKFLHKYIK